MCSFLVLFFLSASAAACAESAKLQWGSPAEARHSDVHGRASQQKPRSTKHLGRDPSVVAAVWQEDDALVAQTQATEDHSVVVQRSPREGNSIEQRMAERPEDPFEQSVDESLTDLNIEDPPIEETQEAIEQEFSRRQERSPSIDGIEEIDPFDAPPQEDNTEEENTDLFAEDTTESQSAQEFDDPFDEPTIEPRPNQKAEEGPLDGIDDALDRETEQDLFGDPLPDKDSLETPDDMSDLFENEIEIDDSDTLDLLEKEQRSTDLNTEHGRDDAVEHDLQEKPESDELRKAREENEKNCAEELAKLRADRIDDIDLTIRVEGNAGEDFPFECSLGDEEYQPRRWPEITYTWKASGLCHKPLYFEQVQLERYGHSWGPYVQPIMSGVHFFGTLPVLPYKMGIRTPCECVYSLGHYRPGNCAPYMIDPVPFTWRAALFEAGAATGISFVIP